MPQEEKTWEKDQESKEAKNTKEKQEGQIKLTNQMTTKTMNQSTGYGQRDKARKLGGRKAAKDSR